MKCFIYSFDPSDIQFFFFSPNVTINFLVNKHNSDIVGSIYGHRETSILQVGFGTG